jgi:hypothetical protein
MKTVLSQDMLNDRRAEVLAYLEFLETVLNSNAAIHVPNRNPKNLNLELTRTLKANAYLLLYNTLEGVMSQLLEEIHTEVFDSNVNLDELNHKLYVLVIKTLNKQNSSDIDETFPHPSARAMVLHWLNDYEKRVNRNQNPHFTGNLDGDTIKEIGRKYGFFKDEEALANKLNSKALETVRDFRNKLAHGEYSFAEIGKWQSFSEIELVANNTLETLENTINLVNDFLLSKKYLRNPPQVVNI